MKKPIWKSDSFIRTGLRHSDKSHPCQDYVIVDGSRGAALCDGISCSIHSEKASEIGAKETISVCREIVGDRLLTKDLVSLTDKSKEACKAVSEELAKRIKAKLKNFPQADSTLAFIYMLTDRYAIIGYIGDSAVIVISDTEAQVFTQTRDYGGPTESIAHHRAAELMDIRVIDMEAENIKAFILTSDGLEEELYTKGNNARVMKKCEKYVNSLFVPDGHKIVENLLDDVTADGLFDDDISLAVLAREEISLPKEPQWLCKCGHRNSLMATYCEKCDKDYFTLYRHADMSEYPSPWEYFSFLNAHPKEEQRVISNKIATKNSGVVNDNSTNINEEQDSKRFKDSFSLIKDSETDNRKYSKSHHQRENPSNINRDEKKTAMMNNRFAIIESVAILLLCGFLAVSIFQLLSVSKRLESMIEKIDDLESSKASATIATTESIATPSEAIHTEANLSADNHSTEATEPTFAVIENEETILSVSGTAMMFSEPNDSGDVLGYVTESENLITPLEQCTVDGVEWFQIKNSSGITGWINGELVGTVNERDGG